MSNATPDTSGTAHVGQIADLPPEGDAWLKRRLINCRGAVAACAVCRSAVGLALEDMADQIDTETLQIGQPTMQARGVILPKLPPQVLIGIVKFLGRNGMGKEIPLYVGPDTITLSELELGQTVVQISSDTSSNALRNLARKIREKTTECCRKQVWKRVLPNNSRRIRVKVTSKRIRL